MLKKSSGLIFVLFTLACTLSANAAPAAGKPEASGLLPDAGRKLEIKSYRFKKHTDKNFERLVLQFTAEDKSTKEPPLTIMQAPGAKEAVVQLTGVSLSGAIPESAINDSYSQRSRYMGALSVNTEDPSNGFSLRVAMKTETAVLDAFWLQGPPRLVLDVYRSASDKTGGHNVSSVPASHHEMTASAPTGNYEMTASTPDKEEESEARSVATAKKTMRVVPAAKRQARESYYCFPANSQVGLSVIFEPKAKRKHSNDDASLRIDLEAQGQDTKDDTIVCYPASAQVVATISYHEGKTVQAETTESMETIPATVTPPPALPAATTPAPAAAPAGPTPQAHPGAKNDAAFNWNQPAQPARDSASADSEQKQKALSPSALLPPMK